MNGFKEQRKYLTERWGTYPKSPYSVEFLAGETVPEYCTRIGNIVTELEGKGSAHIGWHTHRDERQSECWICTLFLVCRGILHALDDLDDGNCREDIAEGNSTLDEVLPRMVESPIKEENGANI